MGSYELIEHDNLSAVEGVPFGSVARYLKRQRIPRMSF